MSLTMIIAILIGSWLAVAAAMLWGVLRINRRHHHTRFNPHLRRKRTRRRANTPTPTDKHLYPTPTKTAAELHGVQAAVSIGDGQASAAKRFALARRDIMFNTSIEAENAMAA